MHNLTESHQYKSFDTFVSLITNVSFFGNERQIIVRFDKLLFKEYLCLMPGASALF